MKKTVLDAVIIVSALIAGGVVSIEDNPLTATIIFLLILASWELSKYLSKTLHDRKENPQKTIP